jgi:hypothetical protein
VAVVQPTSIALPQQSISSASPSSALPLTQSTGTTCPVIQSTRTFMHAVQPNSTAKAKALAKFASWSMVKSTSAIVEQSNIEVEMGVMDNALMLDFSSGGWATDHLNASSGSIKPSPNRNGAVVNATISTPRTQRELNNTLNNTFSTADLSPIPIRGVARSLTNHLHQAV